MLKEARWTSPILVERRHQKTTPVWFRKPRDRLYSSRHSRERRLHAGELRCFTPRDVSANPSRLVPSVVPSVSEESVLGVRLAAGFRGCRQWIDNDPSAGSPTETLLRLLLPLNDQVRSSSQHSGAFRDAAMLRVSIRRPH